MFQQKLMIAIPLEEELLEPLYDWGAKFDFSHVESVELLHVIKKNIMPLEFGLVESPDNRTFHQMLPTLEKFIRDEGSKIIPKDFKGEKRYKIALDFHPEQDFVEMIQKTGTSLLVVSTRGRHGIRGLFHSSFTDYMIKFAPCDVLVVRPKTSHLL